MKICDRILLAVAATLAATAIPHAGYAADTSTERTTMPDFCSERDVTCVLPDGQRVPPVAKPAATSSGKPVLAVPPGTSPGPTTVVTPPVGTTAGGAASSGSTATGSAGSSLSGGGAGSTSGGVGSGGALSR